MLSTKEYITNDDPLFEINQEKALNPEKSSNINLQNAEVDIVFNESEDSTLKDDTVEETECRIIEVEASVSTSMEIIQCNTPNPSYSSSTPVQRDSNTPDLGYSQIPDPIVDESIWRCPEQGCQLQFQHKQR